MQSKHIHMVLDGKKVDVNSSTVPRTIISSAVRVHQENEFLSVTEIPIPSSWFCVCAWNSGTTSYAGRGRIVNEMKRSRA